MTNDEMQKTMEFILAQQAQFAVNIQRLQEEQLRDKPRLARLEDSFQLLVELAESSDTRLDATDTHLNTLEANMVKLEATMAILEHDPSAVELMDRMCGRWFLVRGMAL